MPNYKLKALIVEKFGNQVDFARVLGVKEDRISKVIHGRVTPSDEEKRKMAKKLGVSASEIFTGGQADEGLLKQRVG